MRKNDSEKEFGRDWADEVVEDYVGSRTTRWNDNWLNITRDRKEEKLHQNAAGEQVKWQKNHECFVFKNRKTGRPYKVALLLAIVESIRNYDNNPDAKALWPGARSQFCSEFREIWPYRYKYLDKNGGWVPIERQPNRN